MCIRDRCQVIPMNEKTEETFQHSSKRSLQENNVLKTSTEDPEQGGRRKRPPSQDTPTKLSVQGSGDELDDPKNIIEVVPKKPKKKKKAIFSKQSPKILLFTLYYLRLIMGIGFSAFFTQIKDSLILNSCLTTGAALLSFIPLKIIQLIFYCKNVVSKILFSLIFFGVFGFSLLIAYHYYQSMNKHEATIWGYGSSAMIIVDTILSLLPLRFLKYKFELYFQKQKTVEAQFVIDKILN
eukprot:TRINITY_DN6693_c0_g1_i1.p2 TRINITY_DN6693_c0_g1~~TRINITY_DN6693_c0_g1_i1.p2  ORF type:complete len:238 (+),score=25.39 TRINITY_DN6693_c0_g1_i1:174-887(+)